MSRYTIESTSSGYRITNDTDWSTESESVASEVFAISVVVGFVIFLLLI